MYTFDDFCVGGIWNTSLLLDQTRPQFTPCFVTISQIWIPCLYVWLFLPFFIKRVTSASKLKQQNAVNINTNTNTKTKTKTGSSADSDVTSQVSTDHQNGSRPSDLPTSKKTQNQQRACADNRVPVSFITALKIVLMSLQALVSAIDVIRLLAAEPGVLDTLSSFILLTTYILLCLMLWVEKRNGCTSSSFVFFYFFVLVLVLGACRIYMLIFIWGVQDEAFPFAIVMIIYALNMASLVLTFFNDIPATHPKQSYQPVGKADCPEITSPYPAQLFFTWMRGLMVSGFRHDLTNEDVWKINPRDTSSRLSPQFEKLWAEEVKRVELKNKKRQAFRRNERDKYNQVTNGSSQSVHYSNTHETSRLLPPKQESNRNGQVGDAGNEGMDKTKPNLFLVLVKLMWKEVLIGFAQKCAGDTFLFMGPIVLGALISFLQNYDETKVWQAYALSVLLMGCGLMKSVLFAQSMYAGSLVGLKTKTVLTTAIYKKALTISGSARKSTTVGEIVNLMSVDCQRLQEMMAMFLFSWSTPFQIILAVVLLYRTLGVAIFSGVFFLALTVPINYYLSEKQRVLQTDILDLKDNRIRLVNEIINGMKVLKFYTWEMEFKKKVEAIRNMEIGNLFKIANVFIVLNTLAGLVPFLVGLTTFATYVLMDRNNVLDASKAFVSLALFNLLRGPMVYLATAIVFMVQTIVCVKRISTFLHSEDLDASSVSHDSSSKHAVEIKSGTFSWDRNGRKALNNINIQVPVGSLVAVIGPIGCGKSSLVSSILGEVHKVCGYVNVKGKVGYVSQQAWIQNTTVRENIVFGSEYNRRRYKATVKACQLVSDFEILDGGDSTEIGEKGINISGGQKQRINLARAAYSQSDVFLFDDPLSAVDSHVGKAIFKELIGPDGMLAGKTRILVTHGLQWLPEVDQIIVMSDGRITDQGTYKELMATSKQFSDLINLHTTGTNEQPDILADATTNLDVPGQLQKKTKVDQKRSESRKMSEPTRFQDSLEFEGSCTLLSSVKSIHPESKLTEVESLEKGKMSKDVYVTYIKSAGVVAIPLSFAFYAVFNAFLIMSNFWLAEWTEESILMNASTRSSDEAIHTSDYFLLIYGMLGVGQAVMHSLYSVLFWHAMVKAGHRLHSLLLERLFHAPMAFFDQTPVGRILNRFSRDVDIVDNNLPLIIKDFTVALFWVLGTLFVVLIKTPIFGVVLVPLMVCFAIAQSFYVRTSRQLKRMESIARSPVYTHFSETLTGASAIRAYGVKDRFITESENRIDENQVYYFASQAAIRWLQLNLDVLSNLVVLFAAIFQVVDGGRGSDAGLSITYALQITGIMTYMTRQVCEFETNIVCVERMKEYACIQQEAALVISGTRPASDWPEDGNVSFYDYQLRYRPGLQLVLKGVNCRIQPAQKVGIVGRTGAGKSSLTLGLFRIVESAGGLIEIDGVNIAKLGLHDLRKKLTILPQDPALFSGSLRMNVDPFNEFTDDKLWLALEQSHLKDFVAGQPGGLLYECGEEGSNLSVGQRQLVCLARALLRKTRILILDEATAAVDLETDSLIQATIRAAFHDCTILAIAHRLQTIMDYDKVLVMDAGVVREFDSPERLIQRGGVFYSMCKDAGLV